MRTLTRAMGGFVLGAALSLASQAMATSGVGTLGWSFAATGVGSCLISTGCTAASPATYVDSHYQYGFNLNAASSSSDVTRGLAHSSADVGTGFLALPQLHADATGTASFAGGAFSVGYAEAQGVIGFTWTGAPVDLAVSTFVGTINYVNGGASYSFGEASAALAILDSSVESMAVGSLWYPGDSQYGFKADCSTTGAIAIGETGFNSAKGSITTTIAPTCGSPTFHLNTGDDFYFWARMEVVEASNGFIDASHTFTISLNPSLTPAEVSFVTDNVVPTSHLGLGVPEPGVWSMMLVGFGALGCAMRWRRRLAIA